jgi:flagellar basal body-associated protein FliL
MAEEVEEIVEEKPKGSKLKIILGVVGFIVVLIAVVFATLFFSGYFSCFFVSSNSFIKSLLV